MKYFVLFGFLALLVVLVTNFDSSFAVHMGSHHESMGQHGMKYDKMMTHHMSYHGMCAPGFTSLDGFCVLDDRCGPGVYPGKMCMMDGMMKQYLRPMHQKHAGLSIDQIICVEGKHLMFKGHDSSPACVNPESVDKMKHRGWQTEKPITACTMEYDPVCGVDGKIYGNMCSLQSQHMALKHHGECSVSEAKIIYVDSKLVDCVGIGPQKCMLVRDSLNSEWEMFYDSIEGFDYSEGTSYKLNVLITPVENPPADASSLKYSLIKILDSQISG